MSNVKNLYINSAPGFRDIGGTDENFTITKTSSNFNKIPKRVKLLSARIPFVWDNITTTNNAFTLIELPGPVTHSAVTVPVGRYTGTTLAVALQTTLNAIPGVIHTYTVIYDTNTFKFTIAANGNFQFNFAVVNSIAPALGFTEITTASATSLTSPGVAIIQADVEIFVGSSLVGGIDNGIVPWFTGAATDLHILAVVPINSYFGSIIEYTCQDDEPWQDILQSTFSTIPNTTNVSVEMSFHLFFLSGAPVNLKGAHWSANLIFDF